ncbi:MAG: prepilin-type N-terminal cleavage/methylation domain-containing protein [Candidatus Poribacteria bacterium]
MFKRKENGFTLIEVLLIMLIIGLLAAIAYASVFPSREEGFRVQCLNNRSIINAKIDDYYFQNGTWPDETTFANAILNNADYFPDGSPQCQKKGNYTINANYRAECSRPEHRTQ